MKPLRSLIALLAVSALSACGGNVASTPAPAPQKVPVRVPVRRPPPPAAVQSIPGLEGVIGATAADLTRQFGQPRLEVFEGDARKLQFSGSACVLDIYLYPAAQGREPQASFVEARRASDGQEVDRVACVGALRKR